MQEADACIVKVADFRDTVRQALDNWWTILDNLDNTIADLPDPDERSMLENKLRQAREIALVNSRTIFRAVESMSASARTIRSRTREIVGCKTHAHESSGSSDASQYLGSTEFPTVRV